MLALIVFFEILWSVSLLLPFLVIAAVLFFQEPAPT